MTASVSALARGASLPGRWVVSGLCALLASACGGPSAEIGAGRAAATTDRCVIALRFVSDEDVAAQSPDATGEPAPPTTELSLVRICDQNGRIVTSLGAQAGVCQYEPTPPATLIAARCGWPSHDAVALRVVRDGQQVTAFAIAGDGEGEARALGSVELPERSRVDVLSPGRQLAEPSGTE